MLVTKASGAAGGELEKVQAAEDLGLQIVMIRRPELELAGAVHGIDEAVAMCLEKLGGVVSQTRLMP